MATEAKLPHTAALILQPIDAGFVYGFSTMIAVCPRARLTGHTSPCPVFITLADESAATTDVHFAGIMA
jgi:hypothetical protein